MIRRAAPAFLAIPLLLAAPAAAAQPVALTLPAGRFADAVAALGRQSGASITVEDPSVWARRVPALRGAMPVGSALRRLLAGTGAAAREIAPGIWQVRRAARPRRVAPPALPTAAPASEQAIVVTASKRDLRLADFAGAASILDGAALEFGGPGGTDALLSRLATVSSTYLGAGRNKLFIRGIADSSFTGPTQATVGQYVGDLRLTYNAPDPDLRLYDMAQVEVLEGPQGTLYGAGSLGGIIRLTPAMPDLDHFGGSISLGAAATQHGAASGDGAAMLNLPLGDDRAVRLVGYRVSDGGYIDNSLTGRRNINRTTTTGGRATMRVALAGGWTIDVGTIIQKIHGDDSQYADLGAPRLTRSSSLGEGFDAYYRLAQIVVGRDWGAIHMRSTTGYARQHLAESFDATPAGAAPRLFDQRNDTRLFSSETRVWQPVDTRFGWLLGASYTRNRSRLDRALGPVGATGPLTGVINIAEEANVYGEASLRLARWLTLTAGGRASWTELSGGALHVPILALSFAQMEERSRITTSRHTARYLPSVALAAHASGDVTLYARYQQSFRPGGLAADEDFVRQFRNDRVEAIETGLRLHHSGRMPFDLTVSGSYTFWRDIQADFVDGSGFVTTANIGDGRIWSAAASGSVRIAAPLRLDAAFSFNDGRVTNANPDLDAVLLRPEPSGRRIPNVARVSARLGATWESRLSERLSVRAELWGRYIGKSRLGVGPELGRTQGDYPDSAATVRIGTAGTGVTLGVTNLSDSVGNRFALGTPFAIGRNQITPLRPRTVRIGFDTRF